MKNERGHLIDENVLSILSGKKMSAVFTEDQEKVGEDSSHIFLPVEMELDTSNSALRGAVDHYTGRSRYIDSSIFEKLASQKKGRLAGVLNLLEEIRIGSKRSLEGAGFELNRKAFVNYRLKKVSPVTRGDVAAALALTARDANISLPADYPLDKKALELVNKSMVYTSMAANATSTKENLNYAKQLERLWYLEPPDGSGKKSISPGKDNSTTETLDGTKQETEKCHRESGEECIDRSAPFDVEEDDKGLSKELLPGESSEGSFGGQPYIVDTRHDIVAMPEYDIDARDVYNRNYNEYVRTINGLKQDFASSILTLTRKRFMAGQLSGKLDSRSISRISLTPRVFKRVTKRIDLSTAITFLVDQSGSMRYGRIEGARACSIVLAEECHRLAIPFEVLGFTTHADLGWDNQKEYERLNPRVSRFEPLLHIVYKNFNESYRKVKYRIGCMHTGSSGTGHDYGYNNFDGEAVIWAAQRLFARKEDRKILIVLSDGLPEGHARQRSQLHDNLHDGIKIARLAGMEVYAVGLFHDPSPFYGKENTVLVKSLDDLTLSFFKNFTKILKKGITNV